MVVLGWLVHGVDRETAFDRRFREALPTGNDVLALCADLGSPLEISLLALVVASSAIRAGRPELAVLAVAAPLSGALGSTALKHVFDRHHGDGLAFPSGHATVVTALTVVAVLLAADLARRGWRIAVSGLLCVVPLASSAGLVTEDFHYASDTVGGLGLGVATALGLQAATLSRRASSAGSSAR